MPDIEHQPSPLPDFLQGSLWSYNIHTLDVSRDATRIITNILIYGNIAAVQWLFSTYSHDRIQSALEHPLKGEWDAKSLYFWAGYFQIVPNTKTALKVIEPQT